MPAKYDSRPIRYDVCEFEQAIEEYFEWALKEGRPFTMSGIAVYLGMSRRNLNYYKHYDPEYEKVLDRAKTVIESQMEERALDNKSNASFTMFSLKNHFGWVDKQELSSHVNQNIQGEVKLSLEEEIKLAKKHFDPNESE